MGILTDIIRNKISEHDTAEKERRDNISKGYFEAIQAGVANKTLTQEQLDQYQQEINKLYKGSKGVKEMVGRYGGIVGKVLSAPGGLGKNGQPPTSGQPQGPQGQPTPGGPAQGAPSPQGEPSAAAQVMPPPQAGAPAPSAQGPALPPPKGVSMVPDWAKATEQGRSDVRFQTEEDVRKGQLQFDQRKKQADDLGLQGEAKNDFVATGKYPTSTKPLIIKGLEREGLDGTWTKLTYADGTVEWEKQGATATAIRVTASEATTLEHARELAKTQGKEYKDESGQPLDLDSIPAGMVLQAVHQGPKTFYTTRDVVDKTVNVGGVMYAVNPYQVQQLPQGAGTELGKTALPRAGTTSVAAYDPVSGQMVYNTMPTTSTPATPGIPGRPQAGQPQAPPGAAARVLPPPQGAPGQAQTPQGAPAPGAAAPAAPGTPPRSPQAQAGSKSPPPQPGSVPGLRGLPLTQANTMLQRFTPVRESHSQIFGDPSQPEFTPLSSYADLANNPESRTKIGAALRYTLDQLNTAESGSKQGFWAWAHDVSGFSNELARARASVLQGALGQLNPRETEAYNSTVDAISTAVGLRTLSRASAAQASVRRIENDLPVIGVNVTSSRAFYDKLARLAEITYNGSVGIPAIMFKPGEQEDIKALPARMKKLRDSQPPENTGAQKGPAPPKVGEVKGGHKFKGGDPADPASWEKVTSVGR
jgi:hypothetical protein